MPVDPGFLPVDPLVADLLARCDFPPAGTAVTCALSGGPDSSAMAALAVAAGLTVNAVHVDHGLRARSSDDADTAQSIAASLGISCRVVRVELSDGPNLEARARSARRAAIGPAALTGHTADDQAETVLLALFRGSGAAGLAGIRSSGCAGQTPTGCASNSASRLFTTNRMTTRDFAATEFVTNYSRWPTRSLTVMSRY